MAYPREWSFEEEECLCELFLIDPQTWEIRASQIRDALNKKCNGNRTFLSVYYKLSNYAYIMGIGNHNHVSKKSIITFNEMIDED